MRSCSRTSTTSTFVEPDRVGEVFTVVQEASQTHAGISIHSGETKVWNMAGERPPVCDVLEQIARVSDPTARVWRGSGVATERQGIKILGTPVGHPDFVRSHLVDLVEEQHVLLERPDVAGRPRSVAPPGALRFSPSKLCCEVRQARSSGAVCSSA